MTIYEIEKVPLSTFKTNPSRYMEKEVIITNHGKPQARVTPIEKPEDSNLEADRLFEIKTRLRLLRLITSTEDIERNNKEIADQRTQQVGPTQ